MSNEVKTPEQILKDRFKFYDPNIYGKDVELNGETVIELMEQYHAQFTLPTTKDVDAIVSKIKYLLSLGYNIHDLDIINVARQIAGATAGVVGSDAWISVEDGLPDKSIPVIVCKSNGLVREMYFVMRQSGNVFVYGDSQIDQTSQITHWMPLPLPPKSK